MKFYDKNVIILFLIVFILSFPLVSAPLDVSQSSSDEDIMGVNIIIPDPPSFDNNTALVNGSEILITNEGLIDNIPDLYPTTDARYLTLDQSSAQKVINGKPNFTAGFDFSGDINSNSKSPLFFDEDGTLLYITNTGLGGGTSAFITARRYDNTGSAGFALGTLGEMDKWDVLLAAGTNDIRWLNVAGGQVKSFAMEQATGHLGLGTYSPVARIHAIDTGEIMRLAYNVANFASFFIDSGGNITINSTGGNIFLQNIDAQNITINDSIKDKNSSSRVYFDTDGAWVVEG